MYWQLISESVVSIKSSRSRCLSHTKYTFQFPLFTILPLRVSLNNKLALNVLDRFASRDCYRLQSYCVIV